MAAGGDELNVKVCTPLNCKICEDEEMVQIPGVRFCTTCSHWLCDACVKLHRKFPAMKNHVLEDQAGSMFVSPTACSWHPSVGLSYFCSTCNVCICALCRLDDGEHSGHDCVTIDEKAMSMRSTIDSIISKLQANKNTTEERQWASEKEFSSAAGRLKDLETAFQKAISEQRKRNELEKDRIDKLLEQELKSITEDLKSAQRYLNDANLAIAVTDLSKLTSVSAPRLPEVPEVPKGLHEAGLRILLGEELTQQNLTDILKQFEIKGIMPTRLFEAGLRVMLGEKLTLEQRNELLGTTLTGEQLASFMTPGVRVKPGRDWRASSGDRDMSGTVLSVANGNLRIRWDNGITKWCAMGLKKRYELTLLL